MSVTTAYSIYSQLPSVLEEVPPTATSDATYCGDRDPLIVDGNSSNQIYASIHVT